MKIITGIILATLILTALRPKPNCECEGSIKYYHKGTLVKEVTFKKCYYILGEDCAIVRGERVRYDSIVIRGQGKN